MRMFTEKVSKSNDTTRRLFNSNKVIQNKSIQKHQNLMLKKGLFTKDGAVQLKKLLENDGMASFTKLLQREVDPEEEEPLQMKKENNTGMPNNLKTGVEKLSGIDMSDVKVHYNSSKPSGVGALAYTQGTDIHVGAGQEKHLAHEAWHVVQQTQGRVQPTTQFKDVSINDDPGLEHEADVMGQKALEND